MTLVYTAENKDYYKVLSYYSLSTEHVFFLFFNVCIIDRGVHVMSPDAEIGGHAHRALWEAPQKEKRFGNGED